MRIALLFLALTLSLFGEWDFSGKVGSFYQQNTQVKAGKDLFISDLRANLKFKYEDSEGKIEYLFDFDTIYDPIESARRYFIPTEAKVKYTQENFDIEAGILVLSWGVMDLFSPVDVFNVRNIIKDPLSADKLGSLGMKLNYYVDNAEWSFIAKFIEMPLGIYNSTSPYYIFEPNVRLNPDFSAVNVYRPTLFAKYSGSYESEKISMDYGLIASNGFDTMRGLGTSYDAVNSGVLVTPLLFYSTKLMGYAALPVESFLLKCEMVGAISEDSRFSHYAQLSLGAEDNIEVFNTKSLTLLAEYHKLFLFEPGKHDDIDLFQLFQNDLLLGARLGFNDKYNSGLTLGGAIDLQYSEYGILIEYASKLYDSLSFSLKATKIFPTTMSSPYLLSGSSITLERYNTIFRQVGDFSAVSILLTYAF